MSPGHVATEHEHGIGLSKSTADFPSFYLLILELNVGFMPSKDLLHKMNHLSTRHLGPCALQSTRR